METTGRQIHLYVRTSNGKCATCDLGKRTGAHMRVCKCGEPEMTGLQGSGDFGWFTDYEGRNYCNRCGTRQR